MKHKTYFSRRRGSVVIDFNVVEGSWESIWILAGFSSVKAFYFPSRRQGSCKDDES